MRHAFVTHITFDTGYVDPQDLVAEVERQVAELLPYQVEAVVVDVVEDDDTLQVLHAAVGAAMAASRRRAAQKRVRP